MPDGLLAAWRQAEDRLYPIALVDPQQYQRVVVLVSRTVAELQRTCPDLPSLVAAAPDVADVVRRLAGHQAGELDLSLIAAAACAMRHRRLATELRRRQRAGRIAEAAAAGLTWVLVAPGQTPTSWPPLPSTTVELHLPSGRALVQIVEFDPGTGERSYKLATVDLDPVTGDPLQGGPAAPGLEYGSEAPWRAAIAEERRRIETQHRGG